MKTKRSTTIIVSLALCLVCTLFMSSCNLKEKKQMAQITPEVFEPYLKDYAEDLCLEKYYRNGNQFIGWVIDNSSLRDGITLQDTPDHKGKIGTATIHVAMKGAGRRNMRHGSADVTVSGTISIKSDGTLAFVPSSNYSFNNIVHLDRLENAIEDGGEAAGNIVAAIFGNRNRRRGNGITRVFHR